MIQINNLKEEIIGTIGIVLIAVIVVLMLSFILIVFIEPILSYFGIKKLGFVLSCFIVLAAAIADKNN